MSAAGTVYVVDDDAAVLDSLRFLLEEEAYAVETHASAEDFLGACRAQPPSCAVVDLRMPGMDGLTLQAEMHRRGLLLPLIFLTAHGDIALSVRAMKGGAADFLTKPVTGTVLLDSIRAAMLESERLHALAAGSQAARALVAGLTERERDVLVLAVQGLSNKELARRLGISHRTVEIYKARVLQKTGCETLLDMVRLAETSGLYP